jgi:hypothetical protein
MVAQPIPIVQKCKKSSSRIRKSHPSPRGRLAAINFVKGAGSHEYCNPQEKNGYSDPECDQINVTSNVDLKCDQKN